MKDIEKITIDPCEPENLRNHSNLYNLLLSNMGFQDINPLLAGQEYCDPGYLYGPNFRQYYLIHYVVSGKGTFTVNDTTYNLSKGDMFIIRPYEKISYRADTETPWHYRWIGFTCNMAKDIEFLKKDVIHLPDVEYLFRQILQADQYGKTREIYACAKIFELIALIEERINTEPDKTNKIVSSAVSYIDNNFSNPDFKIGELADILHINRSYLSTLFKEEIGMSPQQYLQKARLNFSTKLLSSSDLSMDEIAIRCGYKNAFHYSKMFKQEFKVPPSKYHVE